MLKLKSLLFLMLAVSTLTCNAQWSAPTYNHYPPLYTSENVDNCYYRIYTHWPGTTVTMRLKQGFFYKTTDDICYRGMDMTCRSNYDCEISTWASETEAFQMISSIYWPNNNPPHVSVSRATFGSLGALGYAYLAGTQQNPEQPGHADSKARGAIAAKVRGITPQDVVYQDHKSSEASVAVECVRDVEMEYNYTLSGYETQYTVSWPPSASVTYKLDVREDYQAIKEKYIYCLHAYISCNRWFL